jgi:chromosome segregation ATPase
MALGFLTNKEAREKITGLEARTEELETELEAANEAAKSARDELATYKESAAELSADLENAKETITELESFKAEAETKIAELEEAAAKTDEKVSIEASRMLAATGAAQPLENPEAGSDASKELTREEFRKLAPAARQAFLSNGGKLV